MDTKTKTLGQQKSTPSSIDEYNPNRPYYEESSFEIKKRKALAAKVPLRYCDESKLSSIVTYDWNTELVKSVDKYCANELDGKGLFVTGPAGTGKTLIVSSIFFRAKYEKGLFVSVPKLVQELRDSIGDRKQAQLSKVRSIVSSDILVLDDLGAEKSSDWTAEVLYLIVNERYNLNKDIIITTNCTPSEISERLGDRTLSRIAEMCIRIKLDTKKDMRLANWE